MVDQRQGGIAWTDETWNPIRGCSRVSGGCRNCYAETVAARFSGEGQPFEGLATRNPGRWTGDVRLIASKLLDPLKWQRPRRVFVNSVSDLFHEKVEADWLVTIFAVMALAKDHTFQVLTKRPARMRDWLNDDETVPRVAYRMGEIAAHHQRAKVLRPRGMRITEAMDVVGLSFPNIWLGTSVEDQATADERLPLLLATPAYLRWVSLEPLLDRVDLFEFLHGRPCFEHEHLDWVVVGGESGPGCRTFLLDWARSVVNQCRAATVPVFVKQMGEQPAEITDKSHGQWSHGAKAYTRPVKLDDRKGTDPEEWPADLRVREWPKS